MTAAVGRPRPRSGDGFGRGLTTSATGETPRREGTSRATSGLATLTTRHAEPVGFCGRGRQASPVWGLARPETCRRLAPARGGEWGSWRVARAHCIDTHTHDTDTATGAPARAADPAGSAGRGEDGGGADPGDARVRRAERRVPGGARPCWREPVCCRGTRRHAGWETDAGIRMMGAWWMPWRWRPRKDAATRRNAPGRRWQPAIRGCPNGATRPAHGRAPGSDPEEGTGGTETSQYPEEQRGFP